MADGCSPHGCSVYNSASAATDSGFVSVVNIGSKPPTATASDTARASARAIQPSPAPVYQSDTIGHISRTSTGTIVRIGGGTVNDATVNRGYVNGGYVNGGYVNGGYVNGGYDTNGQATATIQNGVTVLPVTTTPSAHTLTNGRATVNVNNVSRQAANPHSAGYDQTSTWPVTMQYAVSSKYHQSPASLARPRSDHSRRSDLSRRSSSTGPKNLGSCRLYLVVFLLILCILIVLGVGLYFILLRADVID